MLSKNSRISAGRDAREWNSVRRSKKGITKGN